MVLCLIGGCVYFFASERLRHWTLHIGTLLGTALITMGTVIGPSNHVDAAAAYVWVLIYAALNFSGGVTVAYIGLVATSYATVLGFGPPVGNPVATWLTTVGTGTVAAILVLGLVGLLRSEAQKDPLTGLANRRSWDKRLDDEVAYARRAGATLSIAMIDLDDFKVVNDAYGHEVGDRLLRVLSAGWEGVIRDGGDFLARLGGDEFGLIAPGADMTAARSLTQRLAEAAPEGIAYSIGVATWDGHETAADLLRRADQCMYRKKLVRGDRCRPVPRITAR